VLPVSFNLGQIPKQPLKDIWVSPYVGIDWTGRTVSHVGVSLTATF
jgi:hypothetical protein